MSLQKELNRVQLVSVTTSLMKEVKQKIDDLVIALYLLREIVKDYDVKMEVTENVRFKNEEGKSLAKNTKKVSPETSKNKQAD